MTAPVLIGVDGGGTRTRAMIARSPGDVLGVGAAGPGNFHDLGEAAAGANVVEAVAAAWRDAGCEPEPASSVFVGLGGVVTAPDRACATAIARRIEHRPDALVGVDHDLGIAHAGALRGQPGVVLIAGTGTSCLAQRSADERRMVGGWGRTIDDAGSGYDLGLQALRAVARAEDGRAAPTALRDAVLRRFGVGDPRALMRIVDRDDGRTRELIASLGPCVLEHAGQGEPVARGIVERGVEELAFLIEIAAAWCLEREPEDAAVPTVVVGGLSAAGAVFMQPLWRAIARRAPRARRADAIGSPLEGALWLAARQWSERG